MKITITNTNDAIAEANNLISAGNTIKSILTTLKYIKQTIGEVWQSGAEYTSIDTALTNSISEYENKILVAINKLSTGVIAYCQATEELAASGATNSNKEAYDSPSEWVADNVFTLDGYEAPSTITNLSDLSRGEVDAYIYSKAIDMGMSENQARMAVTIARGETGHYTSPAVLNQNNYGGLLKGYDSNGNNVYFSYDTPDAGVEAYLSNLKTGYFDQGLNTYESIGPVYSPPGNSWTTLMNGVDYSRFESHLSPMD